MSESLIFLSYRRRDALAVDSLVRDLQYQFGSDNIFQDVVSIPSGVWLREEIESQISKSGVLVVVVGPNWVFQGGQVMAHNPGDWVRMEIETALSQDKPIIPVRLENSDWPSKSELPPTLTKFSEITANKLRSGEDTVRDINHIVSRIREHVTQDTVRVMSEFGWNVLVSLLLLVSMSVAGSRWIFSDYSPFQTANVALGFMFALSPWIGQAIDAWLRITRSKWQAPLPTYRRLWMHGLFSLGVGVLLLNAFYPTVSVIDEIYQKLESSRSEVVRASELIGEAESKPRFMDSPHLDAAKQLVNVRGNTDMTRDQAEAVLNYFHRYLDSEDGRLRAWAQLAQGEMYRFLEQPDRQIKLYSKLVTDSAATNWQQWYGYNELGAIAYVWKSDYQAAKHYWQQAVERIATRGVLQNLSIIAEDEQNWDEAESYYQRAFEVLENYKQERQLASLGYQEASLLSNWCNKYRKQAQTLDNKAEAETVWTQAKQKCRLSIAAYPAFMDARWNLSRIQLDSGAFAAALDTQREALRDFREIRTTSKQSLNRHGYLEYAEAYTVWMSVVALFREQIPLAQNARLSRLFQELVVDTHESPEKAVRYLLDRVHAHELGVEEDRVDLEKMLSTGYFDLLTTTN